MEARLVTVASRHCTRDPPPRRPRQGSNKKLHVLGHGGVARERDRT